jgi:hypothetical protein
VVRKLRLSDQGPQASLFCNDTEREDEERWIICSAYRFLLRDPRFRHLRRVRLPRALALDPEMVALALAIRRRPAYAGLDSREFSWAWRHQGILREAARDNPRLLPLVALAFSEDRIPLLEDPVRSLREFLLQSGLMPATWRYLLRTGVRWLRPLWSVAPRNLRTDATVEVLRAFARAGHPPPPERVLSRWLDGWRDRRAEGEWIGLPPAVLAGCCAGLRDPRWRHDDELMGDLTLVRDWARVVEPALDKRQRRAGWPWLRREALAWERREGLAEAGGPGQWPVPCRRNAGLCDRRREERKGACRQRITKERFNLSVPLPVFEFSEGLLEAFWALNRTPRALVKDGLLSVSIE